MSIEEDVLRRRVDRVYDIPAHLIGVAGTVNNTLPPLNLSNSSAAF